MLTAGDHQHMGENGYVVIPAAAPSEDLAAVVDGIWSHMRMDRNDPDSWYEDPNGDDLQKYGFMRQMHTPAMWRVRQSPKIHRAFADLWGTDNLWVNLDRCILKPPLRADRPDWGVTDDPRGLLHWDFPAAITPKRFKLFQAVVYLEDTAADQGTFQCVPGFQSRYEAWHASRNDDFEFGLSNGVPMEQGLESPTPIAGKAGDLLIWDSFNPHGHCYNTSSKPRLAQFMTMWPATEQGHEAGLRIFWPSSLPSNDGSALGEKCGGLEAERRSRITQWREGLQTDYRRPVPERVAGQDDVPSCPLSPLGRRLLGLDMWPRVPNPVMRTISEANPFPEIHDMKREVMRAFAVEDEAIALPRGAWAKSHRVHVRWQGKHIVSLSQGEHRAYLFPVYTPGGFAVTSESPVDHPHHNSLWIGADHVNCRLPYAEDKHEEANYNFYVNEVFQGRASGRVLGVSRECEEVGEDHLRVVQMLNWQGPREWGASEGRIIAVEKRTIDIHPGDVANVIDLRSQLQAREWEVNIGPTRHAYFGVRMAEDLRATNGAKIMGADQRCGSEEIRGQDVKWVDCSGEVAGGKLAGVALLPSPANAANEWSVADWGYISANPLRWSGRKIKTGEEMDLALRIVVHDGDAEEAGIAGFYQSFLDELNDKEAGT